MRNPVITDQYLPMRADFMRKEGTALFNELSATALREVILSPDPQYLSAVACTDIVYDPESTATDYVSSIIDRHSTFIENKTTISTAVGNIISGSYPSDSDTYAVFSALDRFTFHKSVPYIMREAYATMVYFPFNILRQAQEDSQNKELPPVYTSFEDVIDIYRAPWFHNVCTTGAMTSNGVWRGFSTSRSNMRMKLQAKQPHGFDLLPQGDRSIFQFNEGSVRALRSNMQLTNRNAHGRLSQFPDIPETSEGSTSGCPVAHDRAHFKPGDPGDERRLKAVAEILQKEADDLAGPVKNGIVSGLEAMADMFEACWPYIRDAHLVRQGKKEQTDA